jgi:hypothetical protein
MLVHADMRTYHRGGRWKEARGAMMMDMIMIMMIIMAPTPRYRNSNVTRKEHFVCICN